MELYEEIPEHLKLHTQWNRIGEVEDITPAAVYLVWDESDYVTGIQLIVDGGVSVH